MNKTNLLVSFIMLVSILFLSSMISAQDIGKEILVEVNGINVNQAPAVVVGERLLIRVEFTSLVNVQDVTIRAELEGDRRRVEAETSHFDIESGHRYYKTLSLDVPFDLRQKLSGYADLNIRIKGGDFVYAETFQLRVQRESYSVDIISVEAPQTIRAGELFPVDIVLKNLGYNDLNDLFVTVRVPELGIQRTSFFGDLVAVRCESGIDSEDNWGVDISRKCHEDEKDTVSGRIFLQMPFGIAPGLYNLEVEVQSEDTTSTRTIQIAIQNAFPQGNFIVSGDQLLIVNPTNEIVVYRIVPQSTDLISVSSSETLVSVPAGSSKTITFEAESENSGTQTFSVSIFGMDGSLIETVQFSKDFEGKSSTSPIAILTIILAIIFVVLLVVLIILIGKKPQKTEEFGESYY
ncbi:DUF916 domain-containing protein [Patescibacteria group bacterium]|nr:DUF916 domain-containing protein [Patescibacteria group bacterium]